ncbi:MAG TPA: type VI secretion system tip protein VgrG, partial [Nitrospiraceae bacterium]|nr:type VI secretion system tip protein VgrG [Nitrospiraceae bacterium]
MAVIRSKSEADYTFKAGSYSGNKLRVVSFFGSEGISEMFRYNIDLASLDGEVDFDEVIGQPALLTIHGLKGKRYVHGIVSLFEQTGKEGKWTRYRAEVVPAIWILSRHYTCRIFQTQTIPDIIKKVLTDAGISSDQFRFSLKKTYKPRDYCVQYRESDLSFISRLMEQYGIFYLFEHAEDKDIMVIGNDPVVHVPIQDPATVIYHAPGTTGVSDQEHIFEYRFNREIRSGAVMLKDFDFKKPRLNLGAEEKINGDGKLEVYDYPGEYEAPDLGKDLAKVRLEEIQSTQKVGSGQSDCRRFIPGYRFTLDKFSRTELNREYLLIQLTHSGNQPQSLGAEGGGSSSDVMYENRFTCIPSDVSFRPLRLTPRPMIAGPQTAVVVGPKGEEIYTDEYGRVKVQFHWDRDGKQDEKSSCWIRAAQIWAGTGWGAMFIPRIGQEVIVEFLEGDPDQPIITGRVYNGDNMPPYTLPAEKTKSTMKSNSSKGGGGSNEFRFEDAKDSEEIYLHGQKDWTIVIENDKNQKVGKDETLEVGENRDKKVGKDQSEDIGDNKTITVGKNHTEKIGENANID